MTAEPASTMGETGGSSGEWVRLAGRVGNAFGLVLLLLVATYVLASLTSYAGWSAVAVTALGCAAAAVGLASAGARTVIVSWAAALAAGSVTLAIVAELSGERAFLAVATLTQTLLLASAAAAVLRAVIGALEVSFRTILGAISVYMIFGLFFTSLYLAIDRLQAGPFFSAGEPQTGDFIFFSFTTLTTTGYGNLVPDGQPGKMFAGLEMLLGQIFLVTLIAGLVSLWRPRRRSDGPGLSNDAKP
jgi:Ion channel